MTTQFLMFHSDPDRSITNRAMLDAAAAMPDVTITDMHALYGDARAIDAQAEACRLLEADRLVLQFPINWYAPPPLLAAWQDAVLTRMYYIHAATEGRRLAGLPVLVAATAGNIEEAYRPGGVNGWPLAELLLPLRATARRCGWDMAEPFLAYRANRLDDAERAGVAALYAGRIAAWRSAGTWQRPV